MPNIFSPLLAGGGGSGTGKNYLAAITTVNGTNTGNGDFELNATTGWSICHSSLTNTFPSTVGSAGFAFSSAGGSHGGSAASGNLSIAVSSVAALAGTYSLSYQSVAATTVGDMVISDAFFIDTEDQAKVLTFKFYYKAATNPGNENWSGTSSNSYGVAIYDVTNAAWIMPAGVWGMTQSSGVGYCTGTFQTTSNSTQYQIAVFNANATSGNTNVTFDDFSIGPQTAPLGAVMTDWIAYTPTFSAGFGTVASVAVYSRRVGQNLEVMGTVTSGTPAGSAATMTIGYNGANANVTINSAVVASQQPFGEWGTTNTNFTAGKMMYISASTVGFAQPTLNTSGTAVSAPSLQNTNGNSIGGAGNVTQFYFSVPITGWSSNVQMSSDTDTRVVAWGGTSTTTVNNTTPTLTYTSSYDTHGAFSSNTYTVPVSGYYQISGTYRTANSAWSITQAIEFYYSQNGGANSQIGRAITWATSTNQLETTVAATLKCNAGDTLVFKAYSDVSGTPSISTYINRLSGPAVVAATETVVAILQNANSQAVTANVTNFTWSVTVKDTHGMYSAGVFTVPVSGTYQVAICDYDTTGGQTASVYKNGSAFTPLFYQAAANKIGDGVALVNCSAGDTLSVRQDSSHTRGTGAANTQVSVNRVGN